jgi:hypothetical protein
MMELIERGGEGKTTTLTATGEEVLRVNKIGGP